VAVDIGSTPKFVNHVTGTPTFHYDLVEYDEEEALSLGVRGGGLIEDIFSTYEVCDWAPFDVKRI